MNSDNLRHDEAVEPLLQGLREFERFGVTRPANASLNEFLEALIFREIVPRHLGESIISEYHNRRFGHLPDEQKLQEILGELRQAIAHFESLDIGRRTAMVDQLNGQFSAHNVASRTTADPRVIAPNLSVSEPLPELDAFLREAIVDAPAVAHPYWSQKAVLRMALAAAILWTLGVLIGGYIVHDRLDVVVSKVSNTLGYPSSERSADDAHAVREDRQPVQQKRVEMLSNMAENFHGRNLSREALYAYHLSLYYDSSNPDILKGLAWLLLTSRDKSILDPARALPLAKRAVELKPTIENLDTLAEALFQNGDFAQAVEVEQRAIEEGKNSDHRVHLMQQYAKFLTAREGAKADNEGTRPQPTETKAEVSSHPPAASPAQPEQSATEALKTKPVSSQQPEPAPSPLPE